MRVPSLLAAILIVGASVTAGLAPGWAGAAYEGFWASSRKDCRDDDSPNRMSIEGGNRLYWYETRCRASGIKPDGTNAWTMRLACEGEGETFRSKPRISVGKDGKLAIENGPVGQARHQTYVRCDVPKPR